MAGTLFYVDALPAVGDEVEVGGDEGFHAARVARVRVGERLMLGDGAGEMSWCEVVSASRDGLSAQVQSRWAEPIPRPTVTVVQAIPKSERSELAVELATEAGADGFVAWQAARCVARWDGDRAEKGLRRWRAVARSAARQSRRARIPSVDGPASTVQVADMVAGTTGTVLALHEGATAAIAEHVGAATDSVMLLIGPEGGIADDELAALTDAGAVPVRLGPTVLRTSTAAAVALGALGVLTGRWAVENGTQNTVDRG